MYENTNMAGSPMLGCEAKRQATVAEEIVTFAHELAERAEKLSERVHGKLHPVMVPEAPRPCCDASAKLSREYPPLFGELRSRFYSISNALESIEAAMSRTEL